MVLWIKLDNDLKLIRFYRVYFHFPSRIFCLFVCACLCKLLSGTLYTYLHLSIWKEFSTLWRSWQSLRVHLVVFKIICYVNIWDTDVLAVLLLYRRYVFSCLLCGDDRVLTYFYVIAHACVLSVYQKSSWTLNAWLRTHSCLTSSGWEHSTWVFTRQFVFC